MVFIVILVLWLATSLAGGLVIGATIRRGDHMPRAPAHRQEVIWAFARRHILVGTGRRGCSPVQARRYDPYS